MTFRVHLRMHSVYELYLNRQGCRVQCILKRVGTDCIFGDSHHWAK